ncbi:hypothetical protein B5M09_006841 [Aphanomyces astaci]|uniref:dolichol kinase n=2 Tax=Aphanomyces astaci TaxID=112090 RepID=A0A425DDK8_APHAT|nr:hypothetical protein B5M09_006841 [Aphanomyces astaci]
MPWSVTSGIVESILLHGLCLALQVPPNMFLVHVHIALHLYNVLLQYGLAAVSRSFTYGEAMVIAQGMTFLTLDAALFTLHQGSWLRPSSYPVPQRDGIAIIVQVGLVLTMLLLPLLCTPLFHTYGTSTPRIVRPTLPAAPTAHFAGLLVIVAIVFIVWTSFLLHMPLWKWVVDTLLVPSKVGVAAYWLGVLAVAVPCCPIVATRFKLRQIVARKLYHVMVVLLFLPVSFVDVGQLLLYNLPGTSLSFQL